LRTMRIGVLVQDLPLGLFALVYAAAYLLGNTLFRDGAITVGALYVVFFYLDLLQGQLWDMVNQVRELQQTAASINRIVELRNWERTLHDGPGAALAPGPLGLRFDKVSFRYEDDQETEVLRDLSFELRPGAVLGLLGRTGSGKTTLTKLILRLHDPSAGAIHLGQNGTAVDLRQARQEELRQGIAMVTQEVTLFQATLRQNLSLFDDEIDDNAILRVIEQVGLNDWYATLSGGLDTVLEAGGSGLSAGEAQLLAFARVFLRDPGLVILDEASSRLDPATEARIEAAVDQLLAGRTGIIIAHRLDTVGRADEIMILEAGQIVEHGPRPRLAADPDSIFFRLLRTGLGEAMA